MTDQEFADYVHESVHQLIELNNKYQNEFRIGEYARWSYDLDDAKLRFSNEGVVLVEADIQAAGSIAKQSKSWLWSWANSSLPEHVTDSILAVKEFGETHKILKLTDDYWEATEADGWEMSAVANRIIGGRGVYRCPDEKGFFFLILTDICFIQS